MSARGLVAARACHERAGTPVGRAVVCCPWMLGVLAAIPLAAISLSMWKSEQRYDSTKHRKQS
jgi:hypothetical protein